VCVCVCLYNKKTKMVPLSALPSLAHLENSGVILFEGIPPLQHGRQEKQVVMSGKKDPAQFHLPSGARGFLLEHGSPQRLPLAGLALVLPGPGARDDVGLRVLGLAVLQRVVSVHVQVGVALRRALLGATRGEPGSCGERGERVQRVPLTARKETRRPPRWTRRPALHDASLPKRHSSHISFCTASDI